MHVQTNHLRVNVIGLTEKFRSLISSPIQYMTYSFQLDSQLFLVFNSNKLKYIQVPERGGGGEIIKGGASEGREETDGRGGGE